MTPTEYRAALDALAWTPGHLATVLGCTRNLPYQWRSGSRIVPPAVAAWLWVLAEHHDAHPVPDWRTRSAA